MRNILLLFLFFPLILTAQQKIHVPTANMIREKYSGSINRAVGQQGCQLMVNSKL
jgi:hypothetical protein